MIVASTATVRNAADQVRGLYGRRVAIFPPQVLDAGDTFFSEEVPVSREHPGRRYLGVSAHGGAADQRRDPAGRGAAAGRADAVRPVRRRPADPYMTLVGYFNATRELAGMARYLADDVHDRVRNAKPPCGRSPAGWRSLRPS